MSGTVCLPRSWPRWRHLERGLAVDTDAATQADYSDAVQFGGKRRTCEELPSATLNRPSVSGMHGRHEVQAQTRRRRTAIVVTALIAVLGAAIATIAMSSAEANPSPPEVPGVPSTVTTTLSIPTTVPVTVLVTSVQVQVQTETATVTETVTTAPMMGPGD